MSKYEEFFEKEGAIKVVDSTDALPKWVQERMNDAAVRDLPQWVKDLMPGHEKIDLIKDFVNGRMSALSIGEKNMLDAFAAKYGFEYETPQTNKLIKTMDQNRGR